MTYSQIEKLKEINGSVDKLMVLIDEGIVTVDLFSDMLSDWENITGISSTYSKLLLEDRLDDFVKKVISDYQYFFAVMDYRRAYFIHKNNHWMAQILGIDEYEILNDLFEKYIDNDPETIKLFDGITNYKNLLDKARITKESVSDSNIYMELGDKFIDFNVDKAYLCYENALFYCDNEEEKQTLNDKLTMLKGKTNVKNTLVVIVSFNQSYFMQQNIIRIRETLPKGSYKIVVVDNASTDGIAEWLKEQDDILLALNKENIGFGAGCNQAVELAKNNGYGDYDVFLLNNDTRLADNSLFWLRMGLYESEDVGGVGSISNYAGNKQQVEINCYSPREYLEYGHKNNIFMDEPYEERVRLNGFAVLIRNKVWEMIEGFDEQFFPGYFEDDDLSIRIRKLGKRLLVCKNSFIYHAGSQSFNKESNLKVIMEKNYRKLINKYGFNIVDYSYPTYNLIDYIERERKDIFNILILGAGMSADIIFLKNYYKNACVFGVECNDLLRNCVKDSCVFDSFDSLYEDYSKKEGDKPLIFDYVIGYALNDDKYDIIISKLGESIKYLEVDGENVKLREK